MLPALEAGDAVIALMTKRIRRGEIRFFEHPGRPGFWLVKRVGAITSSDFEALSDNDVVDAIDSRSFGRIRIAGSYRLLIRVPRRWNR